MKKPILLIAGLALLPALSSCSIVKGLETDVKVVFEYNDQIISSKTVNQFTNCLVPSLNENQIPVNHEFYGWTWLNPDTIDIRSEEFESTYIEKDGVVHLSDVKDHAEHSTVVLQPLFYNIDDIPVPNYYIAIGWYAKSSTSGLTQSSMDAWTADLKTYLASEGATSEDLANIVVNGYDGDVATAGSLVNKDRYIDVLVGFGNNVDSTGGIDIIEKVGGITMGGKSRYIARLTEKEIAVKVYAWLQTPDGNSALA